MDVINDVIALSDKSKLPTGYELINGSIDDDDGTVYLAIAKQRCSPTAVAVTAIKVVEASTVVCNDFEELKLFDKDKHPFAKHKLIIKKSGWDGDVQGIPHALLDVVVMENTKCPSNRYKMLRSINNSRLCYKMCDEFGLDDMSDGDENGEVNTSNSPYTAKDQAPYWEPQKIGAAIKKFRSISASMTLPSNQVTRGDIKSRSLGDADGKIIRSHTARAYHGGKLVKCIRCNAAVTDSALLLDCCGAGVCQDCLKQCPRCSGQKNGDHFNNKVQEEAQVQLEHELLALKLEVNNFKRREELMVKRLKQQQEKIQQLEENQSEFRRQFDKLIDQLQESLGVAPSSMPRYIMPPCKFTMEKFSHHMQVEGEWFSEPFVSGPNGYKFCLEVIAAGIQPAAGPNISICVKLMRGDNDDSLKWPFMGTITVQILNWREDKTHATRPIEFNDAAVKYGASGPVPCGLLGDRAAKGWGVMQFLPHSYLSYNPTHNTEFLYNDCLRLCVTDVTIGQSH